MMDIALFNKLVDNIDQKRLIESLSDLVSIRSENPFDSTPREGYREKEIGEYYSEMMNQLGLDVNYNEIQQGRPNVFGFRKGSGDGSTLMLAGHLDTVDTEGYDDAYDIKFENMKIYGRGTCDMKGALATYLEVVRLLNASDVTLKGNLIIGGIADEEYQMIGSKHVGANGPYADQGIIGEPTDLEICPANKGQLGTIIKTFGQSVHSSVPERGVNAIIHMAKVIDAFSDYNDELLKSDPHPLCGHGRFSPGVIKGGSIVSTVPDRCELEVDRRVLPGETIEKVFAEYRVRLDRLVDTVPGFKYEITDPTWDIPANDVSLDEPIVQTLLYAYAKVMGKPTNVCSFVAGTDAPNMGFPTVICGPGSISQAHSLNEYVTVDQLVSAVKIYLWCVLDLLS
jgi:acetylornithine deacetylase